MTRAASQLGSISTRIQLQEDFVSALSNSMNSGVGRLVDANMEEESSKLTALQTQQQLADPVAVDCQFQRAEHSLALPQLSFGLKLSQAQILASGGLRPQ